MVFITAREQSLKGDGSLNNLHRVVKDRTGWQQVVKPGDMKYLTLGVLRLGRNETARLGQAKRETVVVLTSGEASVAVDEAAKPVRMTRRNVFDDLPWAIYLPGGHTARIRARRATEFIVAYAPAAKKSLSPRIIGPGEVQPIARGAGNFERTIRNLIVSTDETEHVVFGETINGPGNWSSYPPHKHDTYDPPREWPLEEIYYFKVDPPQGFGFQRVYTADRKLDETYLIENNHAVFFRKGYHPVVAAGGYKLYYFWVIAGKTARLCFVDDPVHAWVKNIKS